MIEWCKRRANLESCDYKDQNEEYPHCMFSRRAQNRQIFVDGRLTSSVPTETALALLDQKRANKKLMLITNSEFAYTDAMMTYAFDRFLPEKMKWRALLSMGMTYVR